MNGSDAEVPVEMAVQHGNVAETDDPFRLFCKKREIEPVDDPYHAISAPGAHNGLYGRIVQHLLHIRRTFLVCSAKAEISFTDGVPGFYFQSPAFHLQNSRAYLVGHDVPGRTG